MKSEADGCPVETHAGESDAGVVVDPRTLPLPPGDMGLPLVGESREFAADPVAFVIERRARYGDVFRTNIIFADTIIMTDEAAYAWIFAGEGKYLENKWNVSTRRLLGDQCTAMLTGETHTHRRQLLMPHFRHSAMAGFAPTIQAIATRHFDRWAQGDRVTTVMTDMQALVFELIVTLLLGDDPEIDIPHLSRLFRAWTAGIASIPVNLPWTTYGRALRANRALQVEIDHIVQRRKQWPEQPNDILGSLLGVRDEHGRPLDHLAIVHELHNQLFAGHDSTVTVMANLMLLLAQHPHILAHGRAEIQSAGLPEQLDLDALKRLPYLNNILDEGMRRMTPVSGTFRIMLQDMAYKGYWIPKGWTVRLEIAGAHMNSDIWSDVSAFDPDRWSPERAEQKRRKYSYLPFGGGPRICLGANFAYAEMRLMLALLLRGYTWELVPDQDLTYVMIPFPRPKSGVQVTFSHATAAEAVDSVGARA